MRKVDKQVLDAAVEKVLHAARGLRGCVEGTHYDEFFTQVQHTLQAVDLVVMHIKTVDELLDAMNSE